MISQYRLDSFLWKLKRPIAKKTLARNEAYQFVTTEHGTIRIYDSGSTKPVLLMVPDGPCFIEHFQDLIQKAKEDFRVIVFDMPGFGFSFPEDGYSHSISEAADTISAIYSAKQIESAILAFSCMNGFYAIRFAKNFPNKVKALILIQTPSLSAMEQWAKRAIPWPIKIPFLGQLIAHAKRLEIPKIWFRIALPKDSEKASEYGDTSRRMIQAGACNCLASVVQGAYGTSEEDLLGVSVPTYLIWGSKDHSHKYTDPNSLKTLIPHVKIAVWDDVGHFANLERTDQFLEICRRALKPTW